MSGVVGSNMVEPQPRVSKLGILLRKARMETGLSQTELAALADSTQAEVSKIERGVSQPRLETIEKFLRAMGLEVVLEFQEGKAR